jgi:hypothetical protein
MKIINRTELSTREIFSSIKMYMIILFNNIPSAPPHDDLSVGEIVH